MSWSPGFLALLRSPVVRLGWAVRIRRHYLEPVQEIVISEGDGVRVVGVRVGGSSVRLQDCSTTIGQIDVTIEGDDLRDLCRSAIRGSIIEVLAILGNGRAEIVAVGQLSGPALVYAAGQALLRADSIVAALRARLDPDPERSRLFYQAGGEYAATMLVADYHSSDGFVAVGSAEHDDFETDGTTGAMLITPGAGPEYAWVLTFTGKSTSPDRLTGVPSTGELGTTAFVSASAVHTSATPIPWLTGHPLDIARRVLVSTGEGTHGTWDTYPARWGLGLSADLIDDDDITRHAALSPSLEWALTELEEIDDGFAWLSGLLAEAGYFITVRQGLLTIRAAQHATTPSTPIEATIQGADLVLEECQFFSYDPDQEAEAATVTLTEVAVSGTYYEPRTLPVHHSGGVGYVGSTGDWPYDQRGMLWTGETTEANRLLAGPATLRTRIGQRLQLVSTRMVHAALACGDYVRLQVDALPSRFAGLGGLMGEVGIVVGVDCDWMLGRVGLDVLVYPSDEVL